MGRSRADPTATAPGTGDDVSDYIIFDPWKSANIICDPDPEYLTVAEPTKTIAVRYLGGGGGLVYGYWSSSAWDAGVVSTTGQRA